MALRGRVIVAASADGEAIDRGGHDLDAFFRVTATDGDEGESEAGLTESTVTYWLRSSSASFCTRRLVLTALHVWPLAACSFQ